MNTFRNSQLLHKAFKVAEHLGCITEWDNGPNLLSCTILHDAHDAIVLQDLESFFTQTVQVLNSSSIY